MVCTVIVQSRIYSLCPTDSDVFDSVASLRRHGLANQRRSGEHASRYNAATGSFYIKFIGHLKNVVFFCANIWITTYPYIGELREQCPRYAVLEASEALRTPIHVLR